MAPVELHEVPSWKLTMYDERTLEPTCARPVTMLEPCRQTKSTSEFSVSFFGTMPPLQQKTNEERSFLKRYFIDHNLLLYAYGSNLTVRTNVAFFA